MTEILEAFEVGLADLVGVNRSTVLRWESGDPTPGRGSDQNSPQRSGSR